MKMGKICLFETLGKRLSSAAVSYPEQRNLHVQWRQGVNTFAPKCLRMYDWAALRNANRSISKAFITATKDTLLVPDIVQKMYFIITTKFCFHLHAQTIWWSSWSELLSDDECFWML